MTAKTTVSKIGEKSVNIRTFDSERTRFTLFLFISSDGDKIPPLVIFKGQKDGIKKRNCLSLFHLKIIKY